MFTYLISKVPIYLSRRNSDIYFFPLKTYALIIIRLNNDILIFRGLQFHKFSWAKFEDLKSHGWATSKHYTFTNTVWGWGGRKEEVGRLVNFQTLHLHQHSLGVGREKGGGREIGQLQNTTPPTTKSVLL